jgi:isoquinoline 1-oxidoreductase beta subunit
VSARVREQVARYARRHASEPGGMLDRRTFLKLSATLGGGVLLGVYGCAERGAAPGAATAANDTALTYIRIEPDDRVVVVVPKSEMGQGVRTALALLVAEELEADWTRVAVETAPFHPKYGDQGTGGSGSVAERFVPLREAGAVLREMLRAAAAAQWSLPVAELVARDGAIEHAASQRRARYGTLLEALARQPVPPAPALKPPGAWTLLGREHVGKDVADIVHGRAGYGLDVRRPGMLYASIERPREFGATLEAFDVGAARAVPGVREVFALEPVPGSGVHGGVVVVATSTWAAFEGRKRLGVRWKTGPHAAESSAGHTQAMRAALDAPSATGLNRIGDPDAALAGAGRVIRADYAVPFLAHATLEPQNCTAHWDGERMTLWAPTQFPNWALGDVAQALGVAPTQVTVNVTLLGGGFGRRINPDFCVEAALVAKQVAAPVQVVWSREDDLGHDFYRPCATHRFEASLDAAGQPAALRHRLVSAAISATYERQVDERKFGGEEAEGAGDSFYRVPARKSEYALLASGVPRGWWRAVSTTHSIFATESFIDELAAAAGQDPLAYRLALIERVPVEHPPQSKDYPFEPARMKACLEHAAREAAWGQPLPEGHALGLACSLDHRSYAAIALEIALGDGVLTIPRVTCAVDCATVINPNGARAQVEGAITQGLSAALHEHITIEAGGVVETNFDRYRLLRLPEAPRRIDVHFISRPEAKITGLGEPALPPVAPALANAIARATGHRLRTLPLDLASIGLRV